MSISLDNFKILESFFEMLASERGVSQNTLSSYRLDLIDFAKNYDADIKNATRQDIEAYLQSLSEAKASTVARRLSALRQFYKFLLLENIRADDPTKLIERPKQPKNLPKYLTEEEVTSLFNVLQGDDPESIRLYALLELLYASGLRVTELISLPLSAFREERDDRRFLYIHGKGGKERLVPLNPSCIHAVHNYLSVRGQFLKYAHAPKAPLYLFPSSAKQGYLTRQRVFQLLKKIAMTAGIDPARISPHVIRHAFATHLLQHGADLLTIQKFLGHADIATTQIYTHMMPNHLTNLVNSYHPLRKIKK